VHGETEAPLGGRFRRHPVFVLAGAAAGVALGVTARAWMRWISTDPEFSWVGTIAIVASFTIFGAAQSAAAVARLRPLRPSAVAAFRAMAIVLSVGLFGAAGAIMLPVVVFGSLAAWRSDITRSIRIVLAAVALPVVMVVVADIGEDNGWGITTVGQIALFLGIYAVIITSTWPSAAPLPDSWRPSRRTAMAVGVGLVALLGLAVYLGGIR